MTREFDNTAHGHAHTRLYAHLLFFKIILCINLILHHFLFVTNFILLVLLESEQDEIQNLLKIEDCSTLFGDFCWIFFNFFPSLSYMGRPFNFVTRPFILRPFIVRPFMPRPFNTI